MSLACYIGPETGFLHPKEKTCQRLLITHPILTNEELNAIKHINQRGWRCRTLDITWKKSEGNEGMLKALKKLCRQAEFAITKNYQLILLSDRNTNKNRVAIPSLLAVGAVHQHLLRKMKRTQVGIILEIADAREVHHHCLLLGYGADAINPYLAYEALWFANAKGDLGQIWEAQNIVNAYRKSVAKGMLKVLAKMGISTIQGYKGAQIFEAIGLSQNIMDLCFTKTVSRIKGLDFDSIANDSLITHDAGFNDWMQNEKTLENDGQFHWRPDGEYHVWSPENIAKLQQAAIHNSAEAYEQYSQLVDDEHIQHGTLRSLFSFKNITTGPIDIADVESAKNIVKRFVTGAMSFGSISIETHETLAIAMNRIKGKSNTGEGGEDESRYITMKNGDSKCSAIKQVASGRFGVTNYYLTNADELQIKIAQGAKPGEGGELPGHKVDNIIAGIRHSTPGVGLISPPPHHDIYSIEDLAQLIFDLKNSNPKAVISVKLVAAVGVGTVAAGVVKGKADHIVIAGHDGGTGASPLTAIKHAGLPWELGLAETQQILVQNKLRQRVKLQADGLLKTGRDVAIAALLGAEEFAFSTAPLIALGCIMMRKCHLNTCPVGIATQDPDLRKKFTGQPEHLINYLFLVAEHTRKIMAKLGFHTIDEMVGRMDALCINSNLKHSKDLQLDLSSILNPLYDPTNKNLKLYCSEQQHHQLENILDKKLINLAMPALTHAKPVHIELPITNRNRTVGTLLSHEIAKQHGAKGLPDNCIYINFQGSAGQSFAAWLAHGVTLELEGDANDYVAKGLCGGRIIIYPDKNSHFIPEENIIIGNVALYGATSGEAYFRGIAGERFAVRNSGANAVVEGIGDHGCEYMTGGCVVVLGPTGRNFAAGMSGGIAYVYDPKRCFSEKCNKATVLLESVDTLTDKEELAQLIRRHYEYTGSSVAKKILQNWETQVKTFKKIIPTDYKRVLEERMAHDEEIELTVHNTEVRHG